MTYGGLPLYAPTDSSGVITFDLTGYLKLLAAAVPKRLTEVDCADCSAALLTFSNALGCGLMLHRVQQIIGGIGFHTNPILAIGATRGHAHFFSQHDVTVLNGATDASARVFDSCLLVDFDSNPASARPAHFALAHGSPRGDLAVAKKGHLKWIERLVKQKEWPICGGEQLNPPCLDQCVGPQIPSVPIVMRWQQVRNTIELLAPPLATGHDAIRVMDVALLFGIRGV